MEDVELILSDSEHTEFQRLAAELEKELFERDGDLANFNHELNKIDFLPIVVLLFMGDTAVACGAYWEYDFETVEIKRMYVIPEHRRKNYASQILASLESLAKGNEYRHCLLETGKNQPEAIAFYTKHGYKQIPNFGKYINSNNSVCFKKRI
jgi:putative acetyltransferase